MPFIPKPPFPNVPKLPGVPQLNRSATFPPAPPPVLGTALALGRLWQALFVQPLWAIYQQAQAEPETNDDGVETVTVVADRQPVVVPDSFLTFAYRKESNIATYPIQNGGFVNYDKVANPFETFVRMSKGGSLQDRKQFLDSLDAIVDTTDLYDILTPEKTYIGVNVLRYELVREGVRGAYFFAEVDLYFQEIRQVAPQYTNTSLTSPSQIPSAQNPEADNAQNIGTVQAQQARTLTPESLGITPPELEF